MCVTPAQSMFWSGLLACGTAYISVGLLLCVLDRDAGMMMASFGAGIVLLTALRRVC